MTLPTNSSDKNMVSRFQSNQEIAKNYIHEITSIRNKSRHEKYELRCILY